jgi:hypothetical protein
MEQMMTTKATMDWAMQALGISLISAGRGETSTVVIGLDGRSIDPESFVVEAEPAKGLSDFENIIDRLPACGEPAITPEATTVHNVSALECPATDGAPSQPAVIHAVHGIMKTGDWFVLAGMSDAVSCREPPAGAIITTIAQVG